jgi:translation initiation factor 2B subunit (eIF-2B alpha/beta/delta family)
MTDDENSDFVGNAAEQKVIREPPQLLSGQGKIAAQQISHGTAVQTHCHTSSRE